MSKSKGTSTCLRCRCSRAALLPRPGLCGRREHDGCARRVRCSAGGQGGAFRNGTQDARSLVKEASRARPAAACRHRTRTTSVLSTSPSSTSSPQRCRASTPPVLLTRCSSAVAALASRRPKHARRTVGRRSGGNAGFHLCSLSNRLDSTRARADLRPPAPSLLRAAVMASRAAKSKSHLHAYYVHAVQPQPPPGRRHRHRHRRRLSPWPQVHHGWCTLAYGIDASHTACRAMRLISSWAGCFALPFYRASARPSPSPACLCACLPACLPSLPHRNSEAALPCAVCGCVCVCPHPVKIGVIPSQRQPNSDANRCPRPSSQNTTWCPDRRPQVPPKPASPALRFLPTSALRVFT